MNESVDLFTLKKPTIRQRDLIRDALRAYRQYGDSDFDSFSWPQVREAIAAVTDKEIGVNPARGGDLLRRFVDGYRRKKEAETEYLIPQPFEAVVEFVIERSLLTKEELVEDTPSPMAVSLLAKYLADGLEMETSLSVSDLGGAYFFVDFHKIDRTETINLTLRPWADGKILQAEETQKVEVKETEPLADRLKKTRDGGRQESAKASSQRSLGWAVPTPEDNLLIFMKDEATGRNHYYISLNDVGIWQRFHQKDEVLYLLRQDFGCEHDPEDYDAGQYADLMLEHVRQYMVFIQREYEAEDGD